MYTVWLTQNVFSHIHFISVMYLNCARHTDRHQSDSRDSWNRAIRCCRWLRTLYIHQSKMTLPRKKNPTLNTEPHGKWIFSVIYNIKESEKNMTHLWANATECRHHFFSFHLRVGVSASKWTHFYCTNCAPTTHRTNTCNVVRAVCSVYTSMEK